MITPRRLVDHLAGHPAGGGEDHSGVFCDDVGTVGISDVHKGVLVENAGGVDQKA